MATLARLGICALLLAASPGCDPLPPLGRVDAAVPRDAAARDAPVDAVRPVDAARDASSFVPAPTRGQAIAMLQPLCDADFGWCGALSLCGCSDVLACDTVYRDCMTDVQSCAALFDVGPLDVDAARLAEHIAQRRRAAAACERYDDPFWCLDVVVERALVGEPCLIGACAGGEGTCIDQVCWARDPAGPLCTSSDTCATGLVCADHQCRAPGALGAQCSVLVPCDAALACIAGTCATPARSGAACGTSRDCARGLACVAGICGPSPTTCARSEECAPGDVCVGATETTCTADVVDGGACARASDCAPGRLCDASGRCVVIPTLGEACESVCTDGLSCDLASHVCVVARDLGAPCNVLAGALCLPGQVCAGTCIVPRGIDAACSEGLCAPGLGCDLGQCVPLRAEGQGCSGRDACMPGLYCGGDSTTGHCTALEADDGPCGRDTDCAFGLYCAVSPSGAGRCRPWLPEGAACAHDDECTPGTACRQAATGTCVRDICGATGDVL